MRKRDETSLVHPPQRLRQHTAFTLIELLVVIAVIGVLAGIALPIYRSVQQKSRAAQCVSNLRQLASAAFLYAADNNSNLPNDGSAVNGNGGTLYPQLLWKYITAPNVPYPGYSGYPEPPIFVGTVFHCPELKNDPSTAPITITALRSYAMNYYMGDGDPNTPTKQMMVPHPASTMMFCDSYNNTQAYNYQLAPRHLGRCNVVYCDGHAEPIVLTAAITKAPAYFDPFWGDLKVNPNQ